MELISYGGTEEKIGESTDPRAQEIWKKKILIPCCSNFYERVSLFNLLLLLL